MMDWTDWEIVKTSSCSYLGKRESSAEGVVTLNPCYEYHSNLVQRQVGPNQVAHVRMKVVQALESGASTKTPVTIRWESRFFVSALAKEDRRELEKLVERAEHMAQKSSTPIVQAPPSTLLRA